MIKDFNLTEILEKISTDNTSVENKVRYALFSLKSQSEKCELIMNLIQSIPTSFWIELAIDCIGKMSADNQEKICAQIAAIFKENENFSKDDSIKLFKLIEEKAVSMGLHKTPLSMLIPKAASFFNRVINDNRYKLFADYDHVYYTSDIDELKTAVVELNERYVNGGSPEIVRCYAYLLTVAQFRLTRFLYPNVTVDDYNLSDTCKACFEQEDSYPVYYDDNYCDNDNGEDYSYCNDEDYDDKYYDDEDLSNDLEAVANSFPHISNVIERIRKSNCIEIARIFDPHLYYIDAELLREIHTAVREVTEKNRYENETPPIVEKSCLFVINPDN